MIESTTLLPTVACLVALTGAITDARTTKIPNVLTFPAAVVGIVLQTIYFGWHGLALSLGGWFTGVAICVLPLLIVQALKVLPGAKKKMGFGDVKLMAALGTFLGPLPLLFVFFYFSLLFGIAHIVRLALDIPWDKISLLVALSRTGQTQEVAKILQPTAVKKPIPIGPLIAVGTLLAIVLDKQTRAYFGIH